MQPLTKTFKAGTHLFHEDDRSRELYIIQSGRVRVFRNIGQRDVDLAVLCKGAVLGEMALIDGKPRSASAVACEDSTVVIIDADTFAKSVSGVPSWFMSMIRTTSEKIRKANARLETIQTGTHSLHIVLGLQYYFLRHAATRDDCPGRFIEMGSSVVQFVQLLSVSHQAVMSVLDLLNRNGIIDVKENRIILVNESKLNGLCDYLRNSFRKSFDKMGAVSPRAQKLVIALGNAIAGMPPDYEKRKEVAASDVLSALSACDIEAAARPGAVQEIKDLGIVSTTKTGTDPAGDKDNPLAGYQFFVDAGSFEKYFLYCSYKDMVTLL